MNFTKIRRVVALATVVILGAFGTTSASAHILYDGGGNFVHQSHGRDIHFINGTSANWNDNVRWAQLEWHGRMNGSLRFPTTSNHDAAYIHAVDVNYGNTGWYGQAYGAGHHGGHGHLQLNQYYNLTYGARNAVACHEIGHFVGMAHSADASDCMSNVSFNQSIASPHIDQLRATWNAWGH